MIGGEIVYNGNIHKIFDAILRGVMGRFARTRKDECKDSDRGKTRQSEITE